MRGSGLPLAHPDLEKEVRRLFDLNQSPEEYAARNSHRWGSFSLDEYQYQDPQLSVWVQRLGDIFLGRNDAPTIASLREKYLSPEERFSIEQEEL